MLDQIDVESGTSNPDLVVETPALPERRRHPRHVFTAAAEIVEFPSGAVNKARTSDLSLSGCFVDTLNPFPEGAPVRLRLAKEKRTFEAKARVVSSKAGQGMGLMFTDLKPENLSVLEMWIGELSGELPAEPAAWDETEQVSTEKKFQQGQQFVLNELILTLMLKGVLTAAEGRAMLKELRP